MANRGQGRQTRFPRSPDACGERCRPVAKEITEPTMIGCRLACAQPVQAVTHGADQALHENRRPNNTSGITQAFQPDPAMSPRMNRSAATPYRIWPTMTCGTNTRAGSPTSRNEVYEALCAVETVEQAREEAEQRQPALRDVRPDPPAGDWRLCGNRATALAPVIGSPQLNNPEESTPDSFCCTGPWRWETHESAGFVVVESRGIEPLTPALQRRCSAN